MATKLAVYNAALTLIGERSLATLSENREPRRILDSVWDSGAVKTCLEAGGWNFGTRTFKIEYDPSVSPDFGFTYGFEKPSDWCGTQVVSHSEYFERPMLSHEFADESGWWWANIDTLYIKMTSDGAAYGGDLTAWTEKFTRYVEAYLASRIAPKLTRSKSIQEYVDDQAEQRLKGAAAKDAQNSGTSVPPEGSWNRSRGGRGGSGGRRDGGTRRGLVG